jgi:hypothetical protein
MSLAQENNYEFRKDEKPLVDLIRRQDSNADIEVPEENMAER